MLLICERNHLLRILGHSLLARDAYIWYDVQEYQQSLNFFSKLRVIQCEGGMSVSYKKLWKMLIDKDMKKKDLCVAAGISHASIAKLGKNENVTTDILVKICEALSCDISDIMEITTNK